MKVCIPTLDSRGLDAAVAGHFGSAPVFTLVDTETGRAEILSNDEDHGDPTGCHSSGRLHRLDVEAVLCHGMGRRALERLAASGIAVFVIREASVRAAVDSLRAGRAALLTARDACVGGEGRGCEEPSRHGVPHEVGR